MICTSQKVQFTLAKLSSYINVYIYSVCLNIWDNVTLYGTIKHVFEKVIKNKTQLIIILYFNTLTEQFETKQPCLVIVWCYLPTYIPTRAADWLLLPTKKLIGWNNGLRANPNPVRRRDLFGKRVRFKRDSTHQAEIVNYPRINGFCLVLETKQDNKRNDLPAWAIPYHS